MFSNQSEPRMVSFMVVALVASSLALSACQKREEQAPADTPAVPAVTGVELGNKLQANKRVTQPMDSFSLADTIFVVVMTEGNAPAATITTRWTYEDGQVVDESSQTIVMSGPATTEFHVMKPSGWPAGIYKVEILLNGAVAHTTGFSVK